MTSMSTRFDYSYKVDNELWLLGRHKSGELDFFCGNSFSYSIANFLLQKQFSLKNVGIRNLPHYWSDFKVTVCTWYIFKWRVTWNEEKSFFKQDITMLKAYIKLIYKLVCLGPLHFLISQNLIEFRKYITTID